jgi:hypothetical protein
LFASFSAAFASLISSRRIYITSSVIAMIAAITNPSATTPGDAIRVLLAAA